VAVHQSCRTFSDRRCSTPSHNQQSTRSPDIAKQFSTLCRLQCYLCVGVNVLVSSSERRSNKLTKNLTFVKFLYTCTLIIYLEAMKGRMFSRLYLFLIYLLFAINIQMNQLTHNTLIYKYSRWFRKRLR
jgi:hypothetical protein